MINWKLRLQNKATLVSLIAVVVAFVYQVLGMFDVVPPISQDEVINGFGLVLNFIFALGIIVDPTTEGVGDSEQALTYTEPR